MEKTERERERERIRTGVDLMKKGGRDEVIFFNYVWWRVGVRGKRRLFDASFNLSSLGAERGKRG